MAKDEVTITTDPIIVENKDDLETYGELEQMGPKEFYTGLWPYDNYWDRKRVLQAIHHIADSRGASVVLCEEDNKKKRFDVKFYQ